MHQRGRGGHGDADCVQEEAGGIHIHAHYRWNRAGARTCSLPAVYASERSHCPDRVDIRCGAVLVDVMIISDGGGGRRWVWWVVELGRETRTYCIDLVKLFTKHLEPG